MELPQIRDDVRQARDAESAHLEAVLKMEAAGYLRLARLHDVLRSRGYGPDDGLELKAGRGEAPRLWLGLAHCVTMEPDASTYRVARHGRDTLEIVLDTTSLDDTVAACAKLLAHGRIKTARDPAEMLQPLPTPKANDRLTLVFVWSAGVITGIAALLVYAIVMKKFIF